MVASPPPGPSAWRALQTLNGFRRDPLALFQSMARDYGDVVLFRMGPRRICVVYHPELVREVLITQNRAFTKSRPLRRARVLLGEGLLTSEGDFHLRQRRLAQPAFHRERIAGHARSMVQHAARLSDGWRDGERIDAHREMMRLTLGIAGETLFGADVLDEAEEIGEALDVAMVMFRRTSIPFSEILDWLPLPSTRRFFAARDRLDRTIYRMIAERRASGVDRGDLLSMLLLAVDEEGDGGAMSDRQVRDEALTLLLAGHETTANALAWTWYLLGQHPQAEEKLREEIRGALGGRLPNSDDIPRLPFTRAVLAESMRLFPPAWIVGREAQQALEVGGFRVPALCTLFVCPWVVHRDARFWPEPQRFLPERWTPEMEAALPRFAYFPFSGGPRKCIGEGFAWTEGILVLATLAQRWRLRLVPGQRVEPFPLITLRPRHGVQTVLQRVG